MKNTITYDWRDGSIEHNEIADSETGTPMWLYHGLGISFRVPEREYDSKEIVEEFRAEFGERLDELRGDFSVEWDGHNHVGHWAGDEEKHCEDMDDITHLIEEWEPECGLEIWDASDYYHGGLTTEQILCELKITAATTDEQLAKIAQDAQDAALVEGRHLSRLSEFVEHMREAEIKAKKSRLADPKWIDAHTCPVCGTRAPECYDDEETPAWDCSTCLSARSEENI
jgi:hypothetical protein